MNYFTKVFNFIFPRVETNKTAIQRLIQNRVLYYPTENSILFLPYKNHMVRDAIWSMKFKNDFTVVDFFGKMIYEYLPDVLESLALAENFNDPVVVTIPMSTSRKIRRGYNQTDKVIGSFLKHGGLGFVSYEKNVLKKSRDTPPQSRIRQREKRLENVKNSFAVARPEAVRGRNVILFDDVKTTGATLSEAEKVLNNAGTKKIIFMVIAH